ncbi:MAG: hypothetical protein BWY67_02000 [Bacteroidetes bacterium ADurb.Bin397]|nr:MAG: hypothetical protein BWY67_02000 [Bacteroidetes bacterium ADurb.Bin397]
MPPTELLTINAPVGIDFIAPLTNLYIPPFLLPKIIPPAGSGAIELTSGVSTVSFRRIFSKPPPEYLYKPSVVASQINLSLS